jgi:hypothetical protein
MERKERHPSERPVRRDDVRRLGFTRRPHEEPLSPGLRRQSSTQAIGFMASLSEEDEE